MSRRDLRSDEGVSLPELVVYVMVSSLLVALMCTMFVQITEATSDSRAVRRATGVAVNVMDELSRVIRQGTAVQTAAGTEGAVIGGQTGYCPGASGSTATCLAIDTYSDVTITPGQATVVPVRVVFTIDANGYLQEARYTATASSGTFAFPVSPTSSRTVNGPVSASGSGTDPLFTYWSGTSVVTPSPALTAAQAASITAVTATVSATNTGSRGSDPVVLQNQVTMPNVAIVNGGS